MNIIIGNKIKDLRTKKHITQDQHAKVYSIRSAEIKKRPSCVLSHITRMPIELSRYNKIEK